MVLRCRSRSGGGTVVTVKLGRVIQARASQRALFSFKILSSRCQLFRFLPPPRRRGCRNLATPRRNQKTDGEVVCRPRRRQRRTHAKAGSSELRSLQVLNHFAELRSQVRSSAAVRVRPRPSVPPPRPPCRLAPHSYPFSLARGQNGKKNPSVRRR